MFVVLLMGAAVTTTGSGEGCGRSWPLCHGEFIPAYAFETLVEYSHRLVTAVEGLLLLGVSVAAWPLRRQRPELRALIPLMIITLILQSGMGAWAVRSPQTPAVMASHFGISLLCFAATFLTWRVLREPAAARSRPRSLATPTGFRWLAWATLAFTVGVAYLGAYVRHTNSELACYTWPDCNGELLPALSGPVGIHVGHRLAAALAMVLVGLLAAWAWRLRSTRPDLARLGAVAFGLILGQAAVGGAIVLTRLSLGSTLGHAALMALLFVVLAELCRTALPALAPVPVPRSRPSTVAAGV
jgi:cytochrome c oxidase assembly protein subunit 15